MSNKVFEQEEDRLLSTEDRRTAVSIKPEPIDWEPQYTEGPSRIVSQFDGTKDCLALLLTGEVVQNIKEINRQNRAVGRTGRVVDAAQTRTLALANRLMEKKSFSTAPKTEERRTKFGLR